MAGVLPKLLTYEDHRTNWLNIMNRYQITMTELAKASGIARPNLHNLMNGSAGRTNPNIETMVKVYRGLESVRSSSKRRTGNKKRRPDSEVSSEPGVLPSGEVRCDSPEGDGSRPDGGEVH